MPPLFSVVVPTYNRKNFIESCIDSVLTQTMKEFELIIVDDGSTDHTVTVLPGYLERGINYIYRNHRGVSSARNAGIRIARGRYIAFLDSDDRWDQRKLELTRSYIEKFPDIKIFHTDEIWFKNGKELKQKEKHKRPEGMVYSQCLPLCCIGMSTAVVEKTVFEKIGMFDEKLTACEDYDFWLRACIEYEVKLIPYPLTLKEGGREDQLSAMPGLDKYRIYSLEKMLGSGLLSELQRAETYGILADKCRIYASGAEKRGRTEEAGEYMKKIEKYKI